MSYLQVMIRNIFCLQSHCAHSGIPDVYMFCIDVIYYITIEGCNNVIVMEL